MNKKNVKIIILMVLFILAILGFSNSVDAAYISISPSKNSGAPGENITVNISSDCVGRVNVSVSNGTLSSNRVWMEGSAQPVTVTLGTSGTTTITVTAEGGKMSNNGVDVDVPAVSKNVSITSNSSSSGSFSNSGSNSNSNGGSSNTPSTPTTPEKSSVATLSNLGIKPNDFSGFKANTYTYNVEVPNETESIEVYAKKGQSGQTISGTGTKTLKEGTNKFEVTVTAEDGKTKKTYTINVTRKTEEETPEVTLTQEDSIEESFGLTELKIEGLKLEPQFQTDIYEYKVKLEEDLEKLNITTLATETNSTVEITGNENLKEGENVITILVKDEKEEKTVAYQIIVNKNISVVENTIDLETDHSKMINGTIIKMSVAVVAILLIIVMIIIYNIQKNKGAEDGYIPYTSVLDDYDNKQEKNGEIQEEFEEPKKKKHSKGKRFK